MNAHTLAVLEFDKVRDLLAARTTTAPGAEEASCVEPSADPGTVHALHARVAELRDVESANGLCDLDAPDVRPICDRVDVPGAVLSGPELAAIGRLLVNLARARAHLTRARRGGDPTEWQRRLTGAPDTGVLADDLERCLDPVGEVRDEATPELARIRRDLARSRTRVQEHLDGLRARLSRPGATEYVTLRGGRYVLPVPAEDRARVPGIVHDRSGSRATLFVEPVSAVPLNNAVEELAAAEAEEVMRILVALSDEVRDHREAIRTIQDLLASLDVDQARVRLGRTLGATRPILTDAVDGIALVDARHPLLAAARGADGVVPLSLTLDASGRVLLITGPNAGGKTVALKTVGLLCLMAQSGLSVTAREGTRLPVFRAILADIGDGQSIEASLSTFTAHVAQLRAIADESGSDTLVLLDEVGGATDPAEGAALGMATLEELLERQMTAVMTTHIASLQTFALTQEGVRLAAMAFDAERGRPTYRLMPGPGAGSHALEIAEREGLSPVWIARARARLDPDAEAARRLVAEAQRLSEEAEHERAAAAASSRAASDALAQAHAAKAEAAAETARAKREARDQVRAEVMHARRRLREAEDALKEARTRAEVGRIEHAVDEIEERLGEATAPPRSATQPVTDDDLQPGARVWVRAMECAGTVLSGPDSAGRVQVQAGAFRSWLPPDALAHIANGTAPAPAPVAADHAPLVAALRPSAPPATHAPTAREAQETGVDADTVRQEIDVRGMRADEALSEVDRFLDQAMLTGVPRVRIIHGKGTGVLRTRIQQMLKARAGIRSFGLAAQWEGGTGATTVDLA